MTLYQNGRIPLDKLVQLDSGADHLSTPKAAAMWYQLRANVKQKYGVTLAITPGWNAYRPYDQQVIGRKAACAQGNCNAAASPGYSSHGGTWNDSLLTGGRWVDAMAFDIGNYTLIGQEKFYAEAAAVGFIVGGITVARAGRTEPWHIIVLDDPFGPVPANWGNVTDFNNNTDPNASEEEDMFTIYNNGGGSYMVVGPDTFIEVGQALTNITGVDGTETLDIFGKAGAKTVVLDQRGYDVLRVNIRAGRPATSVDANALAAALQAAGVGGVTLDQLNTALSHLFIGVKP